MLYPKVHVNMLIFLVVFITTVRIPAIFMLIYWLAIQFLGGLNSIGNDVGGVAFWAHIGGFVGWPGCLFARTCCANNAIMDGRPAPK